MGTAVVLAAVILCVVLAVRKMYRDKKSGKGSCGCSGGCSGCSGCSGGSCSSCSVKEKR